MSTVLLIKYCLSIFELLSSNFIQITGGGMVALGYLSIFLHPQLFVA